MKATNRSKHQQQQPEDLSMKQHQIRPCYVVVNTPSIKECQVEWPPWEKYEAASETTEVTAASPEPETLTHSPGL